MTQATMIATLQHWLESQIIGQELLVNRLLIALLADGHLLVEGAPGLAKTKAINTLSKGIEGDFPSRSVHPRIYYLVMSLVPMSSAQKMGASSFNKGLFFHNLVLADEINRAPAKVQIRSVRSDGRTPNQCGAQYLSIA